MSKLTLKPCPFCGSDDLDLMETCSGIGGLSGEYYVTCWSCYAEGGKEKTRKKAKQGWNRRSDNKEDQ